MMKLVAKIKSAARRSAAMMEEPINKSGTTSIKRKRKHGNYLEDNE
jgi:hypothetical protein